MADMITLLHGLAAQTAEASAAQQASFVNLHNAMNRLEQNVNALTQQLADAVAKQGKVTPAMQSKVDEISTALGDIRKAAETAGDGFEPVEEPTEPGTEEPAPAEPTIPGEGDSATR